MFNLMHDDGFVVDLEQHTPIADAQVIGGDECFQAFHVAGQAVAHALDLVDDWSREAIGIDVSETQLMVGGRCLTRLRRLSVGRRRGYHALQQYLDKFGETVP